MSTAWTTIILAAVGTYSMRAIFLVAARRFGEVPPWMQRVLRQIPPAALASIVLPELVRPHGHFDLVQPDIWAAAIASIVFVRSRSTTLTLVVGMLAAVALQHTGLGPAT